MFLDRVSVLSHYDRLIRSPGRELQLPSVVALKQYVPQERRPPFTRFNLFLRDRFTCQYCNITAPTQELTFDHVVPRSRGGRTSWDNIATACTRCNLKKGSRLPHECGMHPANKPHQPQPLPAPPERPEVSAQLPAPELAGLPVLGQRTGALRRRSVRHDARSGLAKRYGAAHSAGGRLVEGPAGHDDQGDKMRTRRVLLGAAAFMAMSIAQGQAAGPVTWNDDDTVSLQLGPEYDNRGDHGQSRRAGIDLRAGREAVRGGDLERHGQQRRAQGRDFRAALLVPTDLGRTVRRQVEHRRTAVRRALHQDDARPAQRYGPVRRVHGGGVLVRRRGHRRA